MVRSTAESILVTIHKLPMGQFAEVPCPTNRSINDNPPPLKDIPSTLVREGTHWPNAGLASGNLFETRKDWPIPPTPVPTLAPTIKTEEQPKITAIPHTMAMPKQTTEICHGDCIAPFAKMKNSTEKRAWMVIYKISQECTPKTFSNLNPSPSHSHSYSHKAFSAPATEQPASFDILDRYSEQTRLQKEREEKIERLNGKYNLDYYSSLESDSNADQEQDYRYEHKYETLI